MKVWIKLYRRVKARVVASWPHPTLLVPNRLSSFKLQSFKVPTFGTQHIQVDTGHSSSYA